MILGNQRILNECKGIISPFCPEQAGPASYDVRLGAGMKRLIETPVFIGPAAIPSELEEVLPIRGWYRLAPGDCCLATTIETITLPRHLRAVLSGRSSVGRQFLTVHVTAGFIDPGFSGQITLELKNESRSVMYLKEGVRIGQLEFAEVDGCTEGYGDKPDNKYQGQAGPTPSKINKDQY